MDAGPRAPRHGRHGIPERIDNAPSTRPHGRLYLAVRRRRGGDRLGTDGVGAVVEGEPFENDDGTIGHVALRMATASSTSPTSPAYGAVAPTGPGAAVSLMLPVPDVEATLTAVRGGRPGRPWGVRGERQPHAWFVDPFGHRWGISSPLSG